MARNEDAVALLRAGRYREAAQLWETLCASSRFQPALHTLYCSNLGSATMHLGDLPRAIALLQSASDSGWVKAPALRHLGPKLQVALGLAHALRGDLEQASAHRDAALAAVGEPQRGVTMLLDAVLATRRGDFEGVGADAQWRLAEASLTPIHLRGLRLLEAFAHEQGGGAYRSPPSEAADLGVFPRVRAGELDFLAAEWPELRAFLQARGLLAEEQPAA